MHQSFFCTYLRLALARCPLMENNCPFEVPDTAAMTPLLRKLIYFSKYCIV